MPLNRAVIIAIGCFVFAVASRELLGGLPKEVANPVWKLGWIVLCFAALWATHRMGPVAAAAELGLTASPMRGLGIAFLATLPMLVTLAVLAEGGVRLVPQAMLSTAVVAPVTEEVLFRGYLFRQLYRHGSWTFVVAVLATGALFGLAHVGTALRGNPMDLLGVVAITTVGGMFFAWLFVRWNDNLWVPIGVHALMNVWWELFDVAPNALGGWGPNLARALAVAAAIALTLRHTSATRTR